MTFHPPFGLGMCEPKRPAMRRKSKTNPYEKDIQKAIQEAFKLRFRLELKATDAGGRGEVKGLVAVFPKWLREALGLPQVLPFGLEAWLHVPPDFSDLLGRFRDVWVFVEVKRPGEKPRPGQAAFLEARRDEGHVAFWADSVESACAQFEQAMRARVA